MHSHTRPPARLRALAVATTLALSALVAPPVIAGQVQLSGLSSAQQFDRFIVKFRSGSAERSSSATLQRSLSSAASGSGSGAALGLRSLRRLGVGADVIQASRRLDRVQAAALMRQLAANPNVEYVEVDQLLQAAAVPNDSRYSEQWDLYESVAGINAPAAWDKSDGAGSVVAVLDTGIIQHPELTANVLPGYDFVTSVTSANDGDGRDADPADPGDFYTDASGVFHPSSWHGSHVAGTIAAVSGNAAGIAGIAPRAKLLPVRVLGSGGGSTSDIADAMLWAAGATVPGAPVNPNPAEVINLSLGGPASSCSPTMQSAIDSAVMRGTSVVIAAGNSNIDVAGFTPANCNNVIAVAATDRQGDRAYYSNFGARIDIAAPGGETKVNVGDGILSTVDSGTNGPVGASYAFYPGTSMAAPHVSGVIALMQAVAPSPRTPAQVKALLRQSARAVPGACSGGCGAGLLDAGAAVTAAMADADNAAPVASFTANVADMTVTFADRSTDSDGSIASRTWDFGDGSTSTLASPVKSYLRDGQYSVLLRVLDNRGGTSTQRQTITIGTAGGTPLSNGVAVANLSGVSDSERLFKVTVPSGARNLVVKLAGGTGDADLLVKYGAVPTVAVNDCRPHVIGNSEACTFATPQAGVYYVVLQGFLRYAGTSLVATWDGGGTGNQAPVAQFSHSISGSTVTFTDGSSDADGSIVARAWDFGDGATSSVINPTRTYAAAGSYTVRLTVTDNLGASGSKSQLVTIGSSGGSVLQPGQAVTVAGAAGQSLAYTMAVPSGSANLVFRTSGGTGDADLYVKAGSAPSDSVYDCRSTTAGNAESCTIAAPVTGTYHVGVKGYSAFSGVSLVGSYTTGPIVQTYTNATDVAIRDKATVESAITVSGRSGKAPSATPVAVDVVHTYVGDLTLDLVAPDGSVYNLRNRSGGSADNIRQTYTVNLSSETLNGTWKLRVTDSGNGDTGYINSWSLTF